MINFDNLIKEYIKKHKTNWPRINSQRFFLFGKINSLFNLIIQQPDIDKNYLYAKDPLSIFNK